MKKKKVKILDSIAGLGDPRPKEVLEVGYERFIAQLKMREKPPSAATIKALIDEKKRADRYAEVPIGFSRDWAFKPGDEPVINAELAEKWEAAGICAILDEQKKAA